MRRKWNKKISCSRIGRKSSSRDKKCIKCGEKFHGIGGLCPVCNVSFMKKLKKESPNAECWNYIDFEELEREAKEWKRMNKKK